MEDPYLDQELGILKNNVGARNERELVAAETALVHHRTLELAARPLPGSFDLAHLQAIHRHLFQDVYPFAGDLRVVDIRKADDPSGGFMPVSRLRDAAGYVFGELAQENHLRGRGTDVFVGRLGHYLDEVNHLHPFREGNGRTQRVFFSQLAGDAGHAIDWTLLTPELNNSASKAGEEALVQMLKPIVRPDGESISETAARANMLRAAAFPTPASEATWAAPGTAAGTNPSASDTRQQPGPGPGRPHR